MFLLVNTETKRPYRVGKEKKVRYYKNEKAAEAALIRNGLIGYVAVNQVDYYTNMEYKIERTNLLSGKKFFEHVDTPNYCSPASEAYWSN